MTEVKSGSFYNEARAYDITLGPLRFEKPATNPALKCADAFMDAYHVVDGEARLLGEIKAMSCNAPTPVATTVESFAVKHGLKKRTDLAACPTLTTTIETKAEALLKSKNWTVSEHFLKSPTGLTISFVDKEPNSSVAVTYLNAHEVVVEGTECSGNVFRVKVDVNTSELSAF
ncbi:MAG: hypothetical protein HY541_07640 [Deltaproteobacteria bacterium]|nr:hypothetical protein [Deltaproteobacteria bacterium]